MKKINFTILMLSFSVAFLQSCQHASDPPSNVSTEKIEGVKQPAPIQTQEYRSATSDVEKGKAPGMKVKLLSTAGDVKTYAVIFATDDEVVS